MDSSNFKNMEDLECLLFRWCRNAKSSFLFYISVTYKKINNATEKNKERLKVL